MDGAHWGAATGSAGLDLYEVTNYHIRPSISILSNATEINQDAMERLPADIQGILVQSLNEHVWRVTAHNEISDTVALREAYEAHRVEIRELPDDVLATMEEPGQGYGKRTLRKAMRRPSRSVKWRHFSRSLGIFKRMLSSASHGSPSGQNTYRALFATAGGFRWHHRQQCQ